MPWYRRELNRSVQNLLEAGVTVLISCAVIVSRTRGGGFKGNGCVGHASSSGLRRKVVVPEIVMHHLEVP